jgi:hypothetical protein
LFLKATSAALLLQGITPEPGLQAHSPLRLRLGLF